MPRRKQPAIPDELLDRLLGGPDPRTALADGGLLDGLKKALAERALNAELDHHLETGEPDGRTNGRNGYSAKGVFTGTGKLDLQIPRDRLSTFDPQLIAKYQRRFPGFDDKLSIAVRSTHVRPRHEHPRDPGPPARAVRHRGLARPDTAR
jgi:putative transposase